MKDLNLKLDWEIRSSNDFPNLQYCEWKKNHIKVMDCKLYRKKCWILRDCYNGNIEKHSCLSAHSIIEFDNFFTFSLRYERVMM